MSWEYKRSRDERDLKVFDLRDKKKICIENSPEDRGFYIDQSKENIRNRVVQFEFVDYTNQTIKQYDGYFQYHGRDENMATNFVRGVKMLIITFDSK